MVGLCLSLQPSAIVGECDAGRTPVLLPVERDTSEINTASA